MIKAISHINTLGEEQKQQWELAISYLLLLILHLRPAEQHDDLKTVVQEQIPLSRRKDVTDMVYTMADRLREQGENKVLNVVVKKVLNKLVRQLRFRC